MKKYSPFVSPTLWKDSFLLAFIILGGIETVMSITSITLDCIGNIPARIGIVVAAYVILAAIVLYVKYRRAESETTLTIRGINVTVARTSDSLCCITQLPLIRANVLTQ